MRNASRTVSVVLISLMIAACAIFVKAEVSRFNSLPPDYAGKAFYIVPLKDQQGSAEFQVYARSVAARRLCQTKSAWGGQPNSIVSGDAKSLPLFQPVA